jgi:ribosomal protein L11 methyltransferase
MGTDSLFVPENIWLSRIRWKRGSTLKEIKLIIRDLVHRGGGKVPVGDLEKRIYRYAGVTRGVVREAIKDLVRAEEMRYIYVFGTSFLERSFERPVRVSKRIVLKPPDRAYEQKSGEVVITLASGAAFGNGAHPTTCLALGALDNVLANGSSQDDAGCFMGLDVGTGTGVLAIAMAKLGVQEVVGTDIDPCALAEARNNVRLNTLSERIRISNSPVEKLEDLYRIIVANLAFPTLKRMVSVLPTKMEKNGFLVLSGFKTAALEDLQNTYTRQGFIATGESSNRRWGCLTFLKPDLP